ncbi:sodium:calcium antiporter [Candidatus Nitrosotenuis aquarius]|uniref:sodium:calcium antiporter n=1 Tax=Candidatus Nitrosotenuis aquarius TaxID=1846278 RepID=UPI000C1E6328|nr:sodium:calcium antiporter [Candidatus Nitrosotenuis aquarius]
MSEMILDIIILAASIAVLVKSATFAIEKIVRFSKITGIGELAAGFVIVAVATSTPEISVAVFSTHSDNVGITLGDIFGSNVTNIGLVTGLFLLISPIRHIEQKTLRTLLPLLLASSAIPLALLVSQQGSRFIGIVLLGAFGFFLYYTIKSHKIEKEDAEQEKNSALKQLIYFFVGIALVIVSAKFVVDSASSIAEVTGIRQSVIGATVIAFGTSLPELTVDIIAVRKRHLQLALGDIIGSCITNITLVLGLVLVLSSVDINFGILSSLIGFAIVAPFAMFLFLRTAKIKKWHAMALLAIYAAFIITIFEIQILFIGI